MLQERVVGYKIDVAELLEQHRTVFDRNSIPIPRFCDVYALGFKGGERGDIYNA